MSDLRQAAEKAFEALQERYVGALRDEAMDALCAALEQPIIEPEISADKAHRVLTDEVIAELWHANGGFHHHFARAVERWVKGQA